MSWYRFAPYVPVAKRKQAAAKKIASLKKKGQKVAPVILEGKTIAKTFWGKAWCDNLESYSDFENRLPRGRTYVRNGFVIDLQLAPGKITALVTGSSLYKIKIAISKISAAKWKRIVNDCAGEIDSLIELLQGKFSKGVMEIIAEPQSGLFPHPKEIELSCSCPDGADMCKHVAATLYGVGARLDESPEALFLLRQADHTELVAKAAKTTLVPKSTKQKGKTLDDSELSSIFGIDIEEETSAKPVSKPKTRAKAKPKRATTEKAGTTKKSSGKKPKAKAVSKTTKKAQARPKVS